MVKNVCNPSYMGGIGRRTTTQGWPQAKTKTLSKIITKAKTSWTQVIKHLIY
jgi:hypothetical protein